MLERLLFKKIECWILILAVFIGTLGAIGFAYIVQGTLQGYGDLGIISDVAVKVAESPRYVQQVIRDFFLHPEEMVDISVEDRFALNTHFGTSRKLGVVALFEEGKDGKGTVTLEDIESGEILEKWSGIPRKAQGISFFDGTLIVSEGFGLRDTSRSLSKRDKDGKIIWEIDNLNSHHELAVNKEGLIYTPILSSAPVIVDSLYKGRPKFRDDGFAIISADGHVLQKYSLTQILLDNGFKALLFGVGPLEWDRIHLNAVKPAEESSDFWEKGDLLLSLRHLSMIMLYRPSTNKVIWYQVGPWLNQHDPDFLSDHQISVFGNDVVSSFYDRTSETAPFFESGNNIYVYNFITQEATRPYDDISPRLKHRTVTAGLHTIFRDGSVSLWFDNQGIGAFYDKQRDDIKYFGVERNGHLDRRTPIVNSYTWERYSQGKGVEINSVFFNKNN